MIVWRNEKWAAMLAGARRGDETGKEKEVGYIKLGSKS
jgi:hypothetical protein